MTAGIAAVDDLDVDPAAWTPAAASLLAPLLAHVRDDMTVLEVGCGAAAALSLFLARRRYHLRQVAADADVGNVARAREAARRNRAVVEIVQGDLIAAAAGRRFDVVFSAALAGPAGAQADAEVDRIRGFLRDAPAALAPGGRALFTFAPARTPDAAVAAAVDASLLHLVALVPQRPAPPSRAEGSDGPDQRVLVLAVR